MSIIYLNLFFLKKYARIKDKTMHLIDCLKKHISNDVYHLFSKISIMQCKHVIH